VPCYDTQAAQDNKENAEKVHKLTRMLCGVLGRLEEASFEFDYCVDEETDRWWQEHKRLDVERLKGV